ncbi:MAG: hypothetical protein ACFFAH_03790 [Promethearchaeota archaeon]
MSYSMKKLKKTLEHGAVKNMVRGAIFAGIYLVITIIIPFLTFDWIYHLKVENADIEMSNTQYQKIIFWVWAFGLLITGTAFFAYSSPSQSIRRGIFSLIQIILNCFYLWSYKFSGALEVELELIDFGIVSVNITQMVLVYMGIYFLTVILKTYDLVDFIVNREKIKFERGKK